MGVKCGARHSTILIDLINNDFFKAQKLEFAKNAWLLSGFALLNMDALWRDVQMVLVAAPPAAMQVPSGHYMSVVTTSCGDLGWVSDSAGYRYARNCPYMQQPWPNMPASLKRLAHDAAESVGFVGFQPDSCLINVYSIGAKMGLHQDKDERDFTQPIVSVSLGLPATFMFGGSKRSDKTAKILLLHGDVVVWGGVSRLCYHGVQAIKAGHHALLGQRRVNLTFRKAG